MSRGSKSALAKAKGALLLISDVEATLPTAIACPIKNAPCAKVQAAPLSAPLVKIGGTVVLTTGDLLMTNKGPVRISKADGGPGHFSKGGAKGGGTAGGSGNRAPASGATAPSQAFGEEVRDPARLGPGVYLCGRDLAVRAVGRVGTHQFLLLIANGSGKHLKSKEFGRFSGMTLATTTQDEKLVYTPNEVSDVDAINKWLARDPKWHAEVRQLDIQADLRCQDLEQCQRLLIELCDNYEAQTRQRPIPYPKRGITQSSSRTEAELARQSWLCNKPPWKTCLVDDGPRRNKLRYQPTYLDVSPFNSNSFARSLLEVARKEALARNGTDFRGVDLGNNESIPSFYFQKIRKWKSLQVATAAFIGSDFEWALEEPVPSPFQKVLSLFKPRCFLGNERKHGEFNKIDKSKLWLKLDIRAPGKVGAMERGDFKFSKGADPSVRFLNSSPKSGECVQERWSPFETRATEPSATYIITNDFVEGLPRTLIQINLENAYPFAIGDWDTFTLTAGPLRAINPTIDLRATVVLKQISEEEIELTFTARHDRFPDYDHYIDGEMVSHYSAKENNQSGPRLTNLPTIPRTVLMASSSPSPTKRILKAEAK